MKNLFRLLLILVLVLAAMSSSFALIVVDENGKAVSGAKVYAVYSDPCAKKTEIEKLTTTDKKGKFSFSAPIKSNENTIRYFIAYKPGEYIGWVTDKSLLDESELRGLNSKSFEKIVIGRFKSVSGKVTTKSGSPIGGVSVEINQLSFSNMYSDWVGIEILKERGIQTSMKTNPNGRFLFKEIPYNANISVKVQRNGYAPRYNASLTNTKMIAMYPECKIIGKVVDEMGMPVSEADINVYSINGRSCYLPELKTKKDGTFEMKELITGEYQLYATQKDYFPSKMQTIYADFGKVSACKNIILRRGVELSGKIVDEETGKGLPGVTVNVNTYSKDKPSDSVEATSDNNGQYKLRVLPGRISISSSIDGNIIFPKIGDQDIDVGESGLTNFDIVFWSGKSITGRVVDEKKNPVGKCDVGLYGIGGTKTDSDGKFTIKYNPENDYGITGLIAEDPVTGKMGIFIIDVENLPNDIVVVIKPTYSIRVLVKSKSGKALPNAEVSIARFFKPENLFESAIQYNQTNSSGVCVLNKLIYGLSYTLDANKPGYYDEADKRKPVNFKNSSKQVEIVLQPANRVQKGKIIDINNKPVAGAEVSSKFKGQESIKVITDKNGNFTMNGLPDKNVKLEVSKDKSYGSYIVNRYTKNVIIQIVPSDLLYDMEF